VQPLVWAGVSAATAVALLHWVLIAVCVFLVVGVASRTLRRA
jgi:hypothetical protein